MLSLFSCLKSTLSLDETVGICADGLYCSDLDCPLLPEDTLKELTLQSEIEGGGNKWGGGLEKSLNLNSQGVVIIGGGGKIEIGKILMYTETNKT